MKTDILVAGGYGHVGSLICRELSRIYPGRVIAAGLFGAFRWGKELFAIKVDAHGEGGAAEYLITGGREALITAKAAAWAAVAISSRELPKGVYHMEQLFVFEDVWKDIGAPYSFESHIAVGKSSIPYRNVQ